MSAERVDHVAEALRMAEQANDYLVKLRGQPMSGAQALATQLAAVNGNLNALVHAQIASVEQQRIANLLAYSQWRHKDDDGELWIQHEQATKSLADAASALGIGGDDGD